MSINFKMINYAWDKYNENDTCSISQARDVRVLKSQDQNSTIRKLQF